MTKINAFGMPDMPNLYKSPSIFESKKSEKKKRVKLTPAQRLYIWEHPKMYGRTCNICGDKILQQSDLELDHTRALSKGGTKMALAHRTCNRLKASGSLRKIQKTLGFKTKKRKITKTKRKVKRNKGNDNTIFGGLRMPKNQGITFNPKWGV